MAHYNDVAEVGNLVSGAVGDMGMSSDQFQNTVFLGGVVGDARGQGQFVSCVDHVVVDKCLFSMQDLAKVDAQFHQPLQWLWALMLDCGQESGWGRQVGVACGVRGLHIRIHRVALARGFAEQPQPSAFQGHSYQLNLVVVEEI